MSLRWVAAALFLFSSSAMADDPAWVNQPTRTRNWVTLEGQGGKSFLVPADDLDKFRKEAPTKGGSLTLYEGTIPPAGWIPRWEALKNLGVWLTSTEVKTSEYHLEAPKGGGVAFEVVKGSERVAVVETGRGGWLTMAKVSIAKGAPQAPPPPAPAPGTARSPARATPPAPGNETPHPDPAPAPGAGGGAADDSIIDGAAQTLFPGDSNASLLLAAIVRQAEAGSPGAGKAFIESVRAAAAKGTLAAVKESWTGKMRDACSRAPVGNAAMDQARALGEQAVDEDAPAEEQSAGASFDAAPGPIAGACSRWQRGPASASTGPIRLPPRSQLQKPEVAAERASAPPPPAPSAAQAADKAGKAEKGGKAAGKGGHGIFKFLAVLIGAALGAVAGSFLGPVGGLAGLAIGAGLGLYLSHKMD